ncbi:MAG: Hpt domain-containing protein [Bauldia sp.]|nr:Hpt domain-containing protein [Bauldia sp.]
MAGGAASAPADSPSAGSAVDEEHLRRQTMGDRDVERQALILFRDNASAALVAIANAGRMAERCEAAHKLVGAARAIGAWRLAAAAAEIEASGALTADGVAVLAATMTEVTDFIAARLAA